VDLIQPALRVLIELGYDRTIPYGQPASAGLIPTIDTAKLAADLAAATSQGIEAAVTDLATHATTPTTSIAAHLAPSVPTSTGDNPAAATPNVTSLHESQPLIMSTSPAPAALATVPPHTVPPTASPVNEADQTAAEASNSGPATRNDTATQSKEPTPRVSSTTSATSHQSTTPKNDPRSLKNFRPATHAPTPKTSPAHSWAATTKKAGAAR
jgi:hypothetical protein